MTIAVASGKGGTGKTTVSVAMALSTERNVSLLDCDVEEPNAGLFLKLGQIKSEEVSVVVPSVIEDKCTHCGLCADFCNFNALAVTENKVIVFEDLCHSCGGCFLVCPVDAFQENNSVIGKLEIAETGNLRFARGILDVGKAMSPPLIRAVKKHLSKDRLNIIDCPPGNSCPMTTAVKGSDYVILVTEPTPFGLHDLTLAQEVLKEMDIPVGVVVNRHGNEFRGIEEFCERENIEILMKIKEERKIAEACSRGGNIFDVRPEMKEVFNGVLGKIESYARDSKK
ncbi:ATP-binding protein [candidate division WOR-3 bacterium]|nr:ATP-binding protein [candidate division WOR-3 bacterium]